MGSTTISLIDGEFNLQEAREILIDLINKKIHYHSLKNHEKWERNGVEDVFSANRIKELQCAREKILELTSKEFPKDFKLKINSIIEIGGINDF